MGERTSWLMKEAKVNGLFAAHLPRRRRSKVQPQSHMNTNPTAETDALRNVLSEESKMKDRLMESLGRRCSEAEAKVEELAVEKARVERELAAAKFAAQEREQALRDLQESKEGAARLAQEAEESRERAARAESRLQLVTQQLHQVQSQLAQQIAERDHLVGQLQHSLELKASELQNLHALYSADSEEWSAKSAQIEETVARQDGLKEQYSLLHSENNNLLQRMQVMAEENKQLKLANTNLQHKMDHGEASLESSKKKSESHVQQIKEQDKRIKEIEQSWQEAEAKASRFADQLKSNGKKTVFLVKKAETAQQKLIEKDKEVEDLKLKLDDAMKKYRLVKERLDYFKSTAGQQNTGPGCTGVAFGNNNEEEDPSGNAPQVIPTGQRKGGAGSNPRKAPSAAAQRQPGQERYEDDTSVKRERLPDPALAVDSDAPDWMKF